MAASALACTPVFGAEGASGMYLLGGQSLDAGLSPPPGWYFSMAAVQYSGSVGGALQGGVRVASLRKRTDSFSANLLYAPKRKVLGGQLALSVAAPYAYLRLSGEVSGPLRSVERSISGTGPGDLMMGARLGWSVSPEFSNAVALTVWAPTGTYTKGFNPSIGHNRWAGDVMYSLTYVPGGGHTELSAALGYGVNGPNSVTHYRSGNELHLELAVGQRITPHLELGIASYVYQQVSADTGLGATLGTLKGRVAGAGPAFNYSLRVGEFPLVIGARYYKEFDAKRHFEGDLALASMTLRF